MGRPETVTLLGLLDADSEKFQQWLEKIQDLNERVEEEPHELPWVLDEKVTRSPFDVLGSPVSVTGNVAASARLAGTEEKVDLYCDNLKISLSRLNLAVLDARMGLGAVTDAASDFGHGARLKIDGSLGSEVRYRHYLPVPRNHKRATAYKNLITGSRLPNRIDLREALGNGQAHRLDLKIAADLGLNWQAGYKFAEDTALELSGNLSPTFTFDVQASLIVALGLGFSTRAVLAIGEAGQKNDNWTRVCLAREKSSRLSFGLTFGLALKYDLGTSLAQVFEDALDATPTPRLVRTSRQILAYAKDPEKLEEKLKGEAAEVLQDLVEERIVNPLLDEQAVQELVGLAGEVVTFYDGLEGEIQGLWDRILSKVDLDSNSEQGKKVRAWLDRIADLDGSELPVEDFLSGDQQELLEAVEALSGRTIEDVLLDGRLEETLKAAATLAGKAKALLEETDDEVFAKIREFTQKTGIDDLVARLRKIDSLDELRNEARLRVRRAAEKLVGKALDRISEQDLAKIKDWAEQADGYLSYVDPDDETSQFNQLAKKIKGYLEQAKVDYGLNLAFEIERVSRSSALIDFEINPRARRSFVREVNRGLRRVDIRRMLTALLDEQTRSHPEDGEDPKDLDFLLRECVFTNERIRTTGLSAVFSMVGLGRRIQEHQSGRTHRVERSRIALKAAEGRRAAAYTAGLLCNDTTPRMAANSALWLDIRDTGPLDLRLPYDGEPERSLRLIATTDDASTGQQELAALEHLLGDLGFDTQDKKLPGELISAGGPSRFACELRIPIDTEDGDLLQRITSYADGVDFSKELDGVFLDAVWRWLNEDFVTGPPTQNGISIGKIISHGIRLPWFVQNGRSSGALQGMPNPPRAIRVSGQEMAMKVTLPGADRIGSWFIGFARRRGQLAGRVGRIGEAWGELERTDAGYEAWNRVFAKQTTALWKRGTRWPNPMFGFWFWLAAINELAPESLPRIRGFASFRGIDKDAGAEEMESWQSETYLLDGLRDNRSHIFNLSY